MWEPLLLTTWFIITGLDRIARAFTQKNDARPQPSFLLPLRFAVTLPATLWFLLLNVVIRMRKVLPLTPNADTLLNGGSNVPPFLGGLHVTKSHKRPLVSSRQSQPARNP